MNGVATIVPGDALADTPMQTMLNEVHFDQYHLFRSESRVLIAGDSISPTAPTVSTNSPVVPAASTLSATSEAIEEPTNTQPRILPWLQCRRNGGSDRCCRLGSCRQL